MNGIVVAGYLGIEATDIVFGRPVIGFQQPLVAGQDKPGGSPASLMPRQRNRLRASQSGPSRSSMLVTRSKLATRRLPMTELAKAKSI